MLVVAVEVLLRVRLRWLKVFHAGEQTVASSVLCEEVQKMHSLHKAGGNEK